MNIPERAVISAVPWALALYFSIIVILGAAKPDEVIAACGAGDKPEAVHIAMAQGGGIDYLADHGRGTGHKVNTIFPADLNNAYSSIHSRAFVRDHTNELVELDRLLTVKDVENPSEWTAEVRGCCYDVRPLLASKEVYREVFDGDGNIADTLDAYVGVDDDRHGGIGVVKMLDDRHISQKRAYSGYVYPWLEACLELLDRNFVGTSGGLSGGNGSTCGAVGEADSHQQQSAAERSYPDLPVRRANRSLGSIGRPLLGYQIGALTVFGALFAGLGAYSFLWFLDKPNGKRLLLSLIGLGLGISAAATLYGWAVFGSPLVAWDLGG